MIFRIQLISKNQTLHIDEKCAVKRKISYMLKQEFIEIYGKRKSVSQNN